MFDLSDDEHKRFIISYPITSGSVWYYMELPDGTASGSPDIKDATALSEITAKEMADKLFIRSFVEFVEFKVIAR